MNLSSIDQYVFYRCHACRRPETIIGYRESGTYNGAKVSGLYFTECTKCRCGSGSFTDDHPYFSHEHANHSIGASVIISTKGTPKLTGNCQKCGVAISSKQIKRSFGIKGRVLCLQCEGD